MKSTELKVTFQPSGRSVYVLPGTLLLEAAGRAGIILQTPCGGKGTCGKCKLRVVDGSTDAAILPNAGMVLACQTHVTTPLIIDVPPASLFETTDQILTGDTGTAAQLEPVVVKCHFKLEPPTQKDARSDAARFQAAVGPSRIPFHLLQKLPQFLRQQDWSGTAVQIEDRLIALEPGDTTDSAYGVAMDLGTTTIVATLFDLTTGAQQAIASTMNSQVAFGDDVIARISRIRDQHGALNELQHNVLQTTNQLLQTVAANGDIATDQIYELVIAGNSTMQQIFSGLDPSALGEVPFAQVFDAPLNLSATTLGVALNPGAEVFVFPQIGGFVGGDTVAGILAARMDTLKSTNLLVDIGTNGEIVLAHDGKLLATSTAAGPAFEGARIEQGMRATLGAIEKVMIRDGDIVLNVIGNSAPAGLCGTALIDAVAECLRCGIICETGRILAADDAPADLPATLRRRLATIDGKTNFLLASDAESRSGEPIYLWQKDVRELQLATGAIRAGINILLRQAGLTADHLDQVLLAGAFGNFIRRSNARRIGLLPQISCSRIRFIGNAASLGAKLALLSVKERRRAAKLQQHAEHVDLSLDTQFQIEFSDAMIFPDDDIDACSGENR